MRRRRNRYFRRQCSPEKPLLEVVRPGIEESWSQGECPDFEKRYLSWLKAFVFSAAAGLALYNSGIFSSQPVYSRPKVPPEVRLPFVGSYGSAYGMNQAPTVRGISLEEARTNPSARQLFLDQIVEEMEKEKSFQGIEHPKVTYDPSGDLYAEDTAKTYIRFAPKETAQEGGVKKVEVIIKKNQKRLVEDFSKFARVPITYRRSGGGSVLELGRKITKPVYVNEHVFSTCFSIDPGGEIRIRPSGKGSGDTSYLVSTVNDVKSLLRHELQHVADIRDGFGGALGMMNFAQPVSESDFSHFVAFLEVRANISQFKAFYKIMSRPLRVFLHGVSSSFINQVYLSPYRVENPLLFACIDDFKCTMVTFVNEYSPRILADSQMMMHRQ